MNVLDVDILSWLDETEPVHSAVPVKVAHANTLTSTQATGTCFEIRREVLLNMLEKVIGVVPNKDIYPVLTNLQFKVESDKLQIVASSTEMSMSVETSQVTTKVPGVEVFPARTFISVVRETEPNSIIFVEVTVHGLVIVANAYTAEIALSSGQGFPQLEDVSTLTFHEIDRVSFINGLNKVKYALPGKDTGHDSLRMISIRGGKFTACDGARFQQVRINGFKLNMQLPSDRLSHLLKFLAGSDMECVEVGELATKLIFRLGNVVFYMNKLENPYPNVEQLWLRPALSNDQELLVNKQQLITAIKQVKIADSSSRAVGFIIDESTMKIVVKDGNSASTTIACTWQGKPRTLVVNYTHLAEMLRSYGPDECRFLLGEDSKTYKPPVLLKEEDAMATIAQMFNYRAGLS